MDSKQARIFEDRNMLEDPLPRDWVFLCQLGGCPGAIFRQIYKQTPAHGISQRSEERLRILMGLFAHWRFNRTENRSYP
jgi:hypothetical protein